jgi:hypothetical protein
MLLGDRLSFRDRFADSLERFVNRERSSELLAEILHGFGRFTKK